MATDFGFTACDIDNLSEPYVFISYKSEDSGQVSVYARYLHENGINVWYDNGLHAGSDWESYLMSVIEKPACRAVLLFLSSKVADSTVIPLETTQARACKKPTVAIHLEPGLDVEKLLSKAIRVYVDQRQSVKAYAGSQVDVCREVLEAARNAMNGTETVSHRPADELWNNARMFLLNSERSRSDEDITRARGYLLSLTEQYPADYRGWLGLAMCECLPQVTDPDSAAQRLENCAKYYSYVVAAGEDARGSADYTRVKTRMWNEINHQLEIQLESCASDEQVRRLMKKMDALSGRFGHTGASAKAAFDSLRETAADILNQAVEYSENVCTWKHLSDTETELELYVGSISLFEVPAEINGRKVVSIGSVAFYGCDTLAAVSLPATVREIGRAAFENCTSLKQVHLSEGITSIGPNAFKNCRSLEQINIPHSVTCIGDGAFSQCPRLTEIILPDGIRNIGAKAYNGCKGLTVRSRGGHFSPAARSARESHVKYRRIK